MRKKLFLVLVAIGLIFFLSSEAGPKQVVSSEGRKENIGNQLVVDANQTRRQENATVYDKNSEDGENYKDDGNDKCGDYDKCSGVLPKVGNVVSPAEKRPRKNAPGGL